MSIKKNETFLSDCFGNQAVYKMMTRAKKVSTSKWAPKSDVVNTFNKIYDRSYNALSNLNVNGQPLNRKIKDDNGVTIGHDSTTDKTQLPCIDGFSSVNCSIKGSLKFLFLDFDSLPVFNDTFGYRFSSWDMADGVLASVASFVNGFLFESASGKRKIAIVMPTASLEHTKASSILRKIKKQIITKFNVRNNGIASTLVNGSDSGKCFIDTCGSAIRFCFIREEALLSLRAYCQSEQYKLDREANKGYFQKTPKRVVVEESRIIVDSTEDTESVSCVSLVEAEAKPFTWNSYNEELPENLQRKSKVETGIIRFLAGTFCKSSDCNTGGLAIPQEKLAELLDVNQATISRAIKNLTLDGVIIRTSNWSYEGKKAAKYCFAGFYRSWAVNKLSEIKASYSCNGISKEEKIQTIVENTTDGNWNDSLWALAGQFNNLNQFLECVKTIPGSELNGRLQKAWDVFLRSEADNEAKGYTKKSKKTITTTEALKQA